MRLGHSRSVLTSGSLALAAFHLWSSGRIPDPTVVFDESGYLGNARWIAGGPIWEMPFSPAYSAGYSLILAPLMAATSDPNAQWVGVRVINALLLAAVFPLLYAVLRQVMEVPRNRALAGAFAGAAIPAVVAAGVSGIAENLVLPLVPATVLALWWMLDERRALAWRLLLGPTAALLYAAHPRFTLAVGVIAGSIAWAWIRRRIPWIVGLGNGLGLVVGVAAATALNQAIEAARWSEVEHLEGDPGSWLDLVTSRHGLNELALSAGGQLWYLGVGSLGLSLVGLALVVRSSWSGTSGIRAAVMATTVAVAATVFATSVVFFAQNQFRPDHFVYGRHNDSFSTLWIAVAVAFVLDRSHHRRALAVVASGVAIIGLGAVVSIARDPTVHGMDFSPFAVPAITRLLGSDPDGAFVRATVLAVIGTAALATAVAATARASGGRARIAAGLLSGAMVGTLVYLGLGTVSSTDDFHEVIYENWDPVPMLERIGVGELCVDSAAGRGSVNLLYAWARPEMTVRSYRSELGETPPCTFSLAAIDDTARVTAGDRRVLVDEGGSYPEFGLPQGAALWVARGSTADGLDAVGALLPDAFPAALPEAARDAVIAIDADLPEPVRVEPGGRVEFDVEIEHAGSGSPWPDTDSFGRDGRVELLARLVPIDREGRTVTIPVGQFPQWMWPGDTVTVNADLFAVDETLAPLPVGRYEVHLGVGQVGQDWFTTGERPVILVAAVTD